MIDIYDDGRDYTFNVIAWPDNKTTSVSVVFIFTIKTRYNII